MPYLTAAACTPFGDLKGLHTIDLMAEAADEALSQAGIEPGQIDALAAYMLTLKNHDYRPPIQ